jgi:hypothetical protein
MSFRSIGSSSEEFPAKNVFFGRCVLSVAGSNRFIVVKTWKYKFQITINCDDYKCLLTKKYKQ